MDFLTILGLGTLIATCAANPTGLRKCFLFCKDKVKEFLKPYVLYRGWFNQEAHKRDDFSVELTGNAYCCDTKKDLYNEKSALETQNRFCLDGVEDNKSKIECLEKEASKHNIRNITINKGMFGNVFVTFWCDECKERFKTEWCSDQEFRFFEITNAKKLEDKEKWNTY